MRLVVESPEGGSEQLDFRLRRKYSPESIATLLEVTSPREDTDKALLAIERSGRATEAFSYLAGLKKQARLSSMNTLTFHDIKITIQELLWLELGQYSPTSGESASEQDGLMFTYKLQAPPERNLAFPQITAWFRATDRTPYKFELFDDGGRLQKTARIEEVKEIDGRMTITRISIDDQVQSRKWRLDTRSVKYDTGLPAKLFTEEHLVSIVTGASRRLLEGN